MKYVLNQGINPINPTIPMMMKLSAAIRAVIGFSKKVLFRELREMRNGALWLCYTIDGVKCSCFVSAAKFAQALHLCYVSPKVVFEYCQFVGKQFNIAVYTGQHGDITFRHGDRTYYIDLVNGKFELAVGRQDRVRARATNLVTLLNNLVENPTKYC